MKNELLWAVIILIIFFAGAWYATNRVSPYTEPEKTTNMEPVQNTTQQATGLKITDTLIGTGAEAVSGKKITVHYTGTLLDGTKFDSSVDRGDPFVFTLGAGQVIQGWDQGFAGMKVGGKRELVIPPEMGYGARDMGKIPANSTLKFQVELLKVE
jgi:FKBP-type peptidyl-prolyl cis-trans isomerase FkpA